MKFALWGIGKTKANHFVESEAMYSKRIKHYYPLELKYFKHPKNHGALSPNILKQKEAELFLANLKSSDHLILLDEKGKQFDSRGFANQITQLGNRSIANVIFVIGGAYGFSDEIYQRANMKISLSSMTYSHQLVRTIFLEQLYRAFTIIRGESYHND